MEYTMLANQCKQTRYVVYLCFFFVSVFFLNSCSDSDSSTSPASGDYAAKIAGTYRITAAYTTENGWVTPPDGAIANVIATRTVTNELTLTFQPPSGNASIPNVAVSFVSNKYVLSGYYSDGTLYGIVSNNQLDVAASLNDGSKVEFLATKR